MLQASWGRSDNPFQHDVFCYCSHVYLFLPQQRLPGIEERPPRPPRPHRMDPRGRLRLRKGKGNPFSFRKQFMQSSFIHTG